MSEVLVRGAQEQGRRLFKPSIAQEDWTVSNLAEQPSRPTPAEQHPSARRMGAAIWAFHVTSAFYAGIAAPSAAIAAMPHSALAAQVADVAASAAVPQELPVEATSQELAAALKAKGMPVAALSEVLDVERKTIYSWLDEGRDANPANHERLRALHALLSGEADGSLRFFHRFWERSLPGVGSLKAALTSPEVDFDAVRRALDSLRPAVLRAMEADAGRKAAAEARSSAASLTLQLHATT